jgi:cell division protein FtsW
MSLREGVTGWAEPKRTTLARGGPVPQGPDRLLVAMILGLTGFGVVMVFSAGAAFAAKTYGDWTYFLKREAVYGAAGLVAFAIGMRLDYSFYRRLAYPLLFLSMVMLAAVLKVGPAINGAVRWFRWGALSFQPSELAKFALALYLAVLLARKAEKVKSFSVGFLPPLVMTGIFLMLLLKQPDLGTAVIMGVTALGLLFVAGTRTSYILLSVLVAAPIGWKVFIAGEPWRMRRFLAFLYPWQFRRDSGYQLYESLISVGSGGLWGQGLGQGHQKLFFLPEAHTDFILAIIGEELGLVGMLSVLLAFTVLVWRGLRAATRARDAFGCYLAFGVTLLFGLQALVNMCVVLGLLPTKGLPLPLVSYGGTALVMSLFMAGVLANISARNPEPVSLSFWQFLRRSRGRTCKNRRSDGANVAVVVEAKS